MLSFIPLWLVEHRGYGLFAASSAAAIVTAVNVVGNLVAGWSRRRGVPGWLLICIGAAVMGGSSVIVYNEAVPDMVRFGFMVLLSGAGGLIPASRRGKRVEQFMHIADWCAKRDPSSPKSSAERVRSFACGPGMRRSASSQVRLNPN